MFQNILYYIKEQHIREPAPTRYAADSAIKDSANSYAKEFLEKVSYIYP